jgi:hypothetical protein
MPNSRWLLLIHQIPAKPDYLRVKVGRRLQQIGAIPVKSSVYALPNSTRSREDFEWVLREVMDGGGEALLCAVNLVDGLDDAALATLFRDARRKDYEGLTEEARRALGLLATGAVESTAGLAAAIARMDRRLAAIRAIDFFGAPGEDDAATGLEELRERLSGARRAALLPKGSAQRPHEATWVTRAGIEEDRIASAWLIRRFIDPGARFRFLPEGASPDAGEIGFDMFDVEYTHEGNRCTFEVLLERFELEDPGLSALAEVVHDIDLRDEKFGRPETAGVDRLIRGIVRVESEDAGRLTLGARLFDCLYATFQENG